MKRVLTVLALAGLVAAACGGAGSGVATTAPVAVATATPAPSPANTYVFTADLSPANVVPPITDAEASGSGTATLTVFTAKDTTGKIIGANAKLEVTLKGFPATTIIVALLAHVGAAGANGAGVVNSGITADTAVPLTGGSGAITKDNLALTPDNATALLANPAGYYVLAHSQVHASGVARGQLKPKT
jgi:CHRD domain